MSLRRRLAALALLLPCLAFGPSVRAEGDPPPCICRADSLLAAITTFVACIDPATIDAGVLGVKADCTPICEVVTTCGYAVYARASARAGCNPGCKPQFLAPGYKNSKWVDAIDAWFFPSEQCGVPNSFSVASTCSGCTGSCASSQPLIFLSGTLLCHPCEVNGGE